MAKKKRKDKELARLRREVEVLRAQLAGERGPKEAKTAEVVGKTKTQLYQKTPHSGTAVAARRVDPTYIKKDLLRSGILTLIACGMIVGLYAFRTRIPFF